MGRHMTVNRCVPCAHASTFSLQPNFSCQPCVQGGSCERGLLHPSNGYWMHNPFVPQVIPCPLTGACVDRKLPVAQPSFAPGSLHAGDATSAVSYPRMLLAEANRMTDSVRQDGLVVTGNSSRSHALLEYAQGLADTMMQDPAQGPPMLLNVLTYQSILDAWQGLQCAPGYKGLMCGTCDTAYLDTSSTPPRIKRFALYLNRCVDCTASEHVTRVVLALLFIIFWSYIGLGIVCHVKAEHRSLMDIHTSSFVPLRLSAAAASFISREPPSLPASLPEHNSVDTPHVPDVQQGVAMGNMWSRHTSAMAPGVATDQPHLNQERECWGSSEGLVTQQFGASGKAGTAGDKAQVLAAFCRGMHAPQQQQPETLNVHTLQGNTSGGALTSAVAAQPQQLAEAAVPAAGEAGSSSLQQQRRLLAQQPSAGVQRSHNMATLVAVWKVLTSYVQILAMVRYLPVLRLIPGGNILTFGDLSTFTQFAAFDCILPGPPDKLASVRILLSAFGVPALLFAAFLVAWIAMWGVHRAGSVLHRRLVRRSAGSYSTYGSGSSSPFSSLPHSQAPYTTRTSAASSIGTQPVESAAGLPPVLGPPLDAAAAAEDAPSKQVVASASTAAGTKPNTFGPIGKNQHWSIGAGPRPAASKLLQQQSSGKLSRLGSMLTVPPAVSSFLSRLPSSTTSNLERIGASKPPVPLRQYLPLRLMITAGILGYSCYSMFTSNMLQILSCQPISTVQVNSAASDLVASYGRHHYQWLQQRHDITQRDTDRPDLCSSGAASSSTCQVAGLFWRQDYSVQCYAGYHMVLAIIGIVMLGLVGVLIPVVLGVLLWLNRANLKEPHFSLKYSFFYREYNSHLCFWEFVIMGRKLAFLAIFLAFTPQLVNEETVAVLQLQLAVLLSVIVLVLHERLRPFKQDLLNSLEKAVLITLTVTFVLLACAIAVDATHALPRGRFALLLSAGLLNGALLLVFIWRIVLLFWVMFGARMVRLVRQQGGVICRRGRHAVRRALPVNVGSSLRSHLEVCCGVGRFTGGSSHGRPDVGGCTNSPTCQV